MKKVIINTQYKKLYMALALILCTQITQAQFSFNESLADLNGNNGFFLRGENDIDQVGINVSAAGDLNGDGFDDVIIGGETETLGRLSAFVLYGKASGFDTSTLISEVDGTNGFVIRGENDGITSFSGAVVSSIGDVNNDGFDDVAFGDDFFNDSNGRVYVIYGNNTGFATELNLATLNGNNGFIIDGNSQFGSFGNVISSAGDFNNDGIDDFIVGAENVNNESGEAYVIFGVDGNLPANFNVSDLDGNNGFTILSRSVSDFTGASVVAIDDINGDGIDDIGIGAPGSILGNAGGINNGVAYVIFGSSSPFSSTFSLASLDGTNGFTLTGLEPFDATGSDLTSLDYNNDGLADIVVGAPGGDGPSNSSDNPGEAYVVLGKNTPFDSTISVSTFGDTDNSDGFTVFGDFFFDEVGSSLGNMQDVNGDGINDLIIGLPNAIVGGVLLSAGYTYVLYGTDGALPNTISLDNLASGNGNGIDGFRFSGVADNDISGDSVSGAGDVNGDGLSDFIIGARNTIRGNPDPAVGDPNFVPAAGDAYIVFGQGPEPDLIFSNGFE